MILDLDNINRQLDELVKERKTAARKANLFAKKHSVLVPITEGPDRGYSRVTWDDEINRDLGNALDGIANKLSDRVIRLRRARNKLVDAVEEITKLID